jgi:hypothetical protein
LTRPKAKVPGFDRVARVNFDFLKKSKQRRFSYKKKVNGLQLGLAGSAGSPRHPGF